MHLCVYACRIFPFVFPLFTIISLTGRRDLKIRNERSLSGRRSRGRKVFMSRDRHEAKRLMDQGLRNRYMAVMSDEVRGGGGELT